MGRLKDRGLAWGCVAARGRTFGVDFPGFCRSESLEDFCGLIFCEILSEVLEIWDGNLQASLNLLPF